MVTLRNFRKNVPDFLLFFLGEIPNWGLEGWGFGLADSGDLSAVQISGLSYHF